MMATKAAPMSATDRQDPDQDSRSDRGILLALFLLAAAEVCGIVWLLL